MRFPKFLRPERRKSDLDEEIAAHLALAAADKQEDGSDPESAQHEARREFGNTALIKDRTRESWGWGWLERLLQDARYALRQMRKSPGFAAAVIGTLALGIAAATAMFTVVDHVLLQPVTYKDPVRLIEIQETDGKTGAWTAPWLDIEQWMNENHSFSSIAFSAPMGGRNYLEGQDSSWEISGQEVTTNLFQILGIEPQLGQGFVSERPSFGAGKNAGTIVLSDAVWKEAFGGSRSIVGRVVRIDDKSYTVAGVMPPGFRYPAGAFQNRAAQAHS